MGIVQRIHHITLLTKHPEKICNDLMHCFGFQMTARRGTSSVLRSGSATLLVRPRPSSSLLSSVMVDSVCDVALEVDDVENIVKKADQFGVEVLKYPEIISDSLGSVITAQVRSCVGDVIHTLISSHLYRGNFLPHFTSTETFQTQENCPPDCHFDHITFAVPIGHSNSIIRWYHELFGMYRIKVNEEDSPSQGFVVRHNNGGMRLKSFDYWKCAEVSMNNGSNSCKFVIAEELNKEAPNQISTFLREHLGPGIQHVAFLVSDILGAAKKSHMNGARFMIPPNKYYELMEKRMDALQITLPIFDLKKYGILIDVESQCVTEKVDRCDLNNKLLLQAFTKPIFEEETFFMELIERHGATGFGSGNIKALWEMVDTTFKEKYAGDLSH